MLRDQWHGWDHLGVLLSLVYRLVRCLVSLLAVLVRSDLSKDAELLVLRHENQVLRRQLSGRLRWDCIADDDPRPRLRVVSRLALGITAPCRVVYVIDEPARRGFAYGTLRGHPESGEESFVVSIDEEGQVLFTVRAFTRPGTLLARVSGPVGRIVQHLITERYVRAMRRLAAG